MQSPLVAQNREHFVLYVARLSHPGPCAPKGVVPEGRLQASASALPAASRVTSHTPPAGQSAAWVQL